MSRPEMSKLLTQLRRLATCGSLVDKDDAAVLDAFVESQDQSAIAELLRRHGPMVLGVCQRLLSETCDAEDVFQATFLVLVQRAKTIRGRQSLACWLHGVAIRLARRVTTVGARQRRLQSRIARDMKNNANHDLEWNEIRKVLDREIGRLPEKYRAPILLCLVEGKSHQDAAKLLNWPIESLYSRLARARSLLRSRLARRGLATSCIGSALAVGQTELVAAVPSALATTTARLAVVVATGKIALLSGMAPTVATLLNAVSKSLLLAKIETVTVVALFGAFAVTAGVVSHQAWKADTAERPIESQLSHASVQPSADGVYSMSPLFTVVAGNAPGIHQTHSIGFHPDGTRLAALGQHGVVWLWNADTGKELFTYRAAIGPNSLSFSPEGRYIACCRDGGVTLWEMGIGRPRAFFSAKAFNASAVSYHPNGEHFIIAAGNDVVLWDIEKRRDLVTLRGHTEAVICAVASPKFNHVASASLDGSVKLWDFVSGKEIRVLQHGGRPADLCFSLDGNRLAVADQHDGVRIYDSHTGAQVHAFPGHGTVAFSPDGKAVATIVAKGDLESSVRAWDVQTGAPLWSIRHPKRLADVAFHPTTSRVATITSDAQVEVWDIASAPVAVSGGNVEIEALEGVVTTRRPEELLAEEEWTGERRSTLLALSAPTKPERRVRTHQARFTPDGTRVAGTSCDGQIHVWDTQHGHELFQTPAQHNEVWGIGYRADGKQFATVHAGGAVKFWDAGSGESFHKVEHPGSNPSAIDYSPGGKHLAIGDLEGEVRIWDLDTSNVVRTLSAHTARVNAVAYSCAGDRIATVDEAGMLHVWNSENGASLWSLKEPHPVGSVCFSPDGRVVASAAYPGSAIILRDAGTGRALYRLPGAKCVAFSPNGRWVASAISRGCNDVEKLNQGKRYEGEIRIWNAATGALRLALQDDADFTGVSFSPDGNRLAAATNDGFVKLWDVSDLRSMTEPARPRWSVFQSDAHRFRVLFPGNPNTLRLQPDGAFTSERTQFSATDLGVRYSVTFSDFHHDGPTDPRQVLDDTRNRVRESLGAKVISELGIQLRGHPGHEIILVAGDGQFTRMRVILVKEGLYQLAVHGPKDVALSIRGDRFLDSFQLTDQ